METLLLDLVVVVVDDGFESVLEAETAEALVVGAEVIIIDVVVPPFRTSPTLVHRPAAAAKTERSEVSAVEAYRTHPEALSSNESGEYCPPT